MEWHQNSCSFCQGFNYFYCHRIFFMLDTKFMCFHKKKFEKLYNSGNSSDIPLLEKFLWLLSVAYSLLLTVSFIKMSSSCPLHSILTSIFSFTLINGSISKSHLQSSARRRDCILAFQTPKQALQVLQTPSVQSSSHSPFLHSLAGIKCIMITLRISFGASFSPEIACSSKILILGIITSG